MIKKNLKKSNCKNIKNPTAIIIFEKNTK